MHLCGRICFLGLSSWALLRTSLRVPQARAMGANTSSSVFDEGQREALKAVTGPSPLARDDPVWKVLTCMSSDHLNAKFSQVHGVTRNFCDRLGKGCVAVVRWMVVARGSERGSAGERGRGRMSVQGREREPPCKLCGVCWVSSYARGFPTR